MRRRRGDGKATARSDVECFGMFRRVRNMLLGQLPLGYIPDLETYRLGNAVSMTHSRRSPLPHKSQPDLEILESDQGDKH